MESTTAPVPVPVVPLEEAIAAERAFLELHITQCETTIAELERQRAALAGDLLTLQDPRLVAMAARIATRTLATAQIVPVQPIDKAEVAKIIASVPGVLEEAPITAKRYGHSLMCITCDKWQYAETDSPDSDLQERCDACRAKDKAKLSAAERGRVYRARKKAQKASKSPN